MQYAASIDDFARIMKDGNNGGYANTWLVADRKTNEIASLELGLKNVTLLRKSDGYFVGSNFPVNPKLVKEETNFNVNDMGESANARHVRWEQLMAKYKGKIDVAAAQRFLADHYDTFEKKEDADERTLCGHVDLSPRGVRDGNRPTGRRARFRTKLRTPRWRSTCPSPRRRGTPAASTSSRPNTCSKHSGFSWEKSLLRDMDAYPWTTFTCTVASQFLASLVRSSLASARMRDMAVAVPLKPALR